MSERPVYLPNQAVKKGIDAVRESGLTNMFDVNRVMELAGRMGFKATTRWILTHHEDYGEGILRGFAVLEEEEKEAIE